MWLYGNRKVLLGLVGMLLTWSVAMWGPYSSETTITQGYMALSGELIAVGGWLVAERREIRLKAESDAKSRQNGA